MFGHVNGIFKAKDKRMKVYCDKVVELVKRFCRIDIQAIKRELNAWADGLAKGKAYGECEKKKEITNYTIYLPDVHMIEVGEEGENASMEEC